MIVVSNLTKQFGDQVLIERSGFQINLKERVGLVGRNGHGKTTLLRILIGQDSYDEGSVTIPKHYRIGYVRQNIAFTQTSILKEGMTGLIEKEKDHFWKVEKILSGLGFAKTDFGRPPEDFSAGYQERLNLAKVLVSSPDLLLLDEPTNYLDIMSIRWVERFLQNWPRELILITHDRVFMDRVVTHTMGVHRKKIRKIQGGTEKYYNQLAVDEAVYEKTRLKDDRRRKEIEQFIGRFRAKARLANLVQSRIKTLSKLEKHEKLAALDTLEFTFRGHPFEARQMLQVKDLSFGYHPDTPIIEHFNLTIQRGDRLCVVGKNGKGKTTLLRLLSGSLKPQKGSIQYNPEVSKGTFEQSTVADLVASRTVEEEIFSSHPVVSNQLARNICGAMMFEGDSALKKIGVLSGGERSRVMLGKILATPVNLLLLDEPTNHLDMESCDALLVAIDNFEGAVIMVTHNEMLLHGLAQRLVVFQKNNIDVFDGSYQRFLEQLGWDDEKAMESKQSPEKRSSVENIPKKEKRRRRSEIIQRRSKVLNPIQKHIDTVEQKIDTNETKLKTLEQDMLLASNLQDKKKIVATSKEIRTCRNAIDHLFDQLDRLTQTFDQKHADFEKQLIPFN